MDQHFKFEFNIDFNRFGGAYYKIGHCAPRPTINGTEVEGYTIWIFSWETHGKGDPNGGPKNLGPFQEPIFGSGPKNMGPDPKEASYPNVWVLNQT